MFAAPRHTSPVVGDGEIDGGCPTEMIELREAEIRPDANGLIGAIGQTSPVGMDGDATNEEDVEHHTCTHRKAILLGVFHITIVQGVNKSVCTKTDEGEGLVLLVAGSTIGIGGIDLIDVEIFILVDPSVSSVEIRLCLAAETERHIHAPKVALPTQTESKVEADALIVVVGDREVTVYAYIEFAKVIDGQIFDHGSWIEVGALKVEGNAGGKEGQLVGIGAATRGFVKFVYLLVELPFVERADLFVGVFAAFTVEVECGATGVELEHIEHNLIVLQHGIVLEPRVCPRFRLVEVGSELRIDIGSVAYLFGGTAKFDVICESVDGCVAFAFSQELIPREFAGVPAAGCLVDGLGRERANNK